MKELVEYLKKWLIYILTDSYYCSGLITSIFICILYFGNFFVWNITLYLMMTSLIGMLLFLNINGSLLIIGKRGSNRQNMKKLLISVFINFILIFIFSYFLVLNEYTTATKINKTIAIEKKEFDIYFYDPQSAIFLFVKTDFINDDYRPYVLYIDSVESYNTVKKQFKSGDINIERKLIKKWYDNKPSIYYYLHGYKFK